MKNIVRPGAILLLCASLWILCTLASRTAIIDWTDLHQEIDGFGASSANIPALRAITDSQAELFFNPANGIGLSLLRTQIQPDGSSTEIITARKAVAQGVKVWASPWSPPAAYKTNGKLNNGGYLLRSEYEPWARMLARYVKMMKSNGIPIYAVSVQNEPDIAEDYPSCLYTAQDIHDFVPYLHTEFRSERVGDTKIMIAEDSQWTINLSVLALADPAVVGDISIIAAHGYGLRRIKPFSTGRAHLWETEVWGDKGVSHYDGSINEGIFWALKINQFLTSANVNAWHWWTIMTDGDDNGGLTDENGNPAKRLFVLGQWSKFVRPGWSRIGVSYNYFGSLRITAFKDSGNRSFAIVAVNSGREAISQTFHLSGFSANSVTPWITSERLSLAAQAPIAVSGTNFAYKLSPLSVTTFVGTAAKTP